MLFWIGPNFHFVQYPVRRGELFNQVAVFKSERYQAETDDWGSPVELEERFRPACAAVKAGLSLASVPYSKSFPLAFRPSDPHPRSRPTCVSWDRGRPCGRTIAASCPRSRTTSLRCSRRPAMPKTLPRPCKASIIFTPWTKSCTASFAIFCLT